MRLPAGLGGRNGGQAGKQPAAVREPHRHQERGRPDEPSPSLGANGSTPYFSTTSMTSWPWLRAVNAPFRRPGWVFHPRTLNTLEKVKDGNDRYLAEAGLSHLRPHRRRRNAAGLPVPDDDADPGQHHDRQQHRHDRGLLRLRLGRGVGRGEPILGDRVEHRRGTTAATARTWHSAFHAGPDRLSALMTDPATSAMRKPTLFTVMTGVRP